MWTFLGRDTAVVTQQWQPFKNYVKNPALLLAHSSAESHIDLLTSISAPIVFKPRHKVSRTLAQNMEIDSRRKRAARHNNSL